MKIKLKHIVIIQCLLVSFTLYMFRELFIITLPVWLITVPIWSPLVVYYLFRIGFHYYRRKHPKEYLDKDDKYEVLSHRYQLLELENKNIKSSHTEVLKSDKKINLDGLKWMWSKPPEILRKETHFEITTSHNYDNGRRMETYSNLEDAISNAKQKYDSENHPKMSEDNFKYWNTKDEIITKVTTIKEIMAVVRAEEKI
ncbi:MAG: hypothetical protein IPJ01_10295 [Micavibrio sp.]|nr:hypothetical protein [Micavibrio sp.]